MQMKNIHYRKKLKTKKSFYYYLMHISEIIINGRPHPCMALYIF